MMNLIEVETPEGSEIINFDNVNRITAAEGGVRLLFNNSAELVINISYNVFKRSLNIPNPRFDVAGNELE